MSGGNSYGGPYVNMSQPSAGMVRFNNNRFEVYDGAGWQIITMNSAHMDVSNKTREILRWAEAKMNQEREIMRLVESNPTVADAYQTYQDAADRLAVVMTLVKEEK